jgi:hypothetical protein
LPWRISILNERRGWGIYERLIKGGRVLVPRKKGANRRRRDKHREITRTSYDSEEKHRVMTKTNYVSASVALLAALLAASLLALGLPDVALPQEVDVNNKPQGGTSDGQVGVQLATAEQVITSNGPLTSIAIGNDLSCQVDHEGNGAGGEFYEGASPLDPNTSCGTLLAVGDTTFGRFYEDFTPVSQSDVVGRGTKERPFKVTTVVDVGDTGLRIIQTDSYVVGNNFYTTKITVKNRGTSRQDVVLYHYGDCYLNLTDENTRGKVVQSSLGRAPACESTDPNAPGQISLLPRSGGYKYQAGDLDATFAAFDNQVPYGNTCDDCPNEVDSGVGLSWELSIGPGVSKDKTLRTKVVIPRP